MKKSHLGVFTALAVAACATHGAVPKRTAAAPSARAGYAARTSATFADGTVKIGKPYQVLGRWYSPVDDRAYDVTGIASWYGPGFHALSTANGETYDQDGLSAAHKTLPMPCYVEVENLDNGRRLTVRVNDRGPFVEGRIIDLSRRGAQLLGVDGPGTAHVRVRRVFPDSATMAALAPARAGVLAAATLAAEPPPRAATAPAIAASPVVRAADPVVVAAEHPVAPAAASVDTAASAAAPAVTTATSGPLIQVAAVSDAGRAAWLAGYLTQFGPARVETTPGGLHRVRLGPYSSTADASAALSRVHAAGYGAAWIVGAPASRPPAP